MEQRLADLQPARIQRQLTEARTESDRAQAELRAAEQLQAQLTELQDGVDRVKAKIATTAAKVRALKKEIAEARTEGVDEHELSRRLQIVASAERKIQSKSLRRRLRGLFGGEL